jgi:hypothetical protein
LEFVIGLRTPYNPSKTVKTAVVANKTLNLILYKKE